MSVSKVLVPPLRPVAPGTRLVAEAIADVAAWLHAAGRRWLERRADAAADSRRLRDRAELVQLARQYERSQPSFAKDLLAACQADRD